jgi:uncharacterized membrane protein
MKQRIPAIDMARGLVMVLMAVDHARGFGPSPPGAPSDPMDLATVSPLLFALRWASHFCAPVFAFLMGASAALSGAGRRSLVIRGLVLIVLEFTVVNCVWAFTPFWPRYFFQVIAALGCGSIALALLAPLGPRVVAAIGLAIVFGHNLLDPIRFAPGTVWHYLWSVLHQKNVLPLWPGLEVRTTYPILPIVGLAAVGYGTAPWLQDRRRLIQAGLACIGLFLCLRLTNAYGDPSLFAPQSTWLYTLFSLGNVTKYPLSLQFILMTMGPALIFLALAPRVKWIEALGQAPLFFYVAHLAGVHLLGLAMAVAAGYSPWEFDFRHHYGGMPPDFSVPLWWTLPMALSVSYTLAPACRWYARLRQSRRYPLLAWL